MDEGHLESASPSHNKIYGRGSFGKCITFSLQNLWTRVMWKLHHLLITKFMNEGHVESASPSHNKIYGRGSFGKCITLS